MKSLADQLREKLVTAPEKEKVPTSKKEPAGSAKSREKPAKATLPIMEAIATFDNSQNKTMVHVRFDSKTADTMNKFKMATNIDVTKFVAFAVKHLFETHPELKTIIKQFIQNTEL
ncbi:hypothetical protein J3L21_32640 [Mucilaginibacter rubeus]|nr:hypothetical protein [Mucilaginibacter rubeus]QTE50224.1 hypothetical protein J3L21_32640 [Mucilaginibacter rubeus]QTE55312.1 hypothetical protein J3L23_24260 [Mucilaginibacter rubeus]QTF63982.1 hypothetical protein J3L20_09240 [Mucilaginibacter rubeus]